ncbi:MAG: hypothetical protein V5B38_02530 [Candidatus Accumulibacter propinquus]|jgi:SulP family sulfate permease
MELAIKFKNDKLVGDFWGGLAAMLVALPSAIAFGVTIYAAIGPATPAWARWPGFSGRPLSGWWRRRWAAPIA